MPGRKATQSARRRFYRALGDDRSSLQAAALRINTLTREQIAEVMEQLPTDALEWAVRFEGLSHKAQPGEL